MVSVLACGRTRAGGLHSVVWEEWKEDDGGVLRGGVCEG